MPYEQELRQQLISRQHPKTKTQLPYSRVIKQVMFCCDTVKFSPHAHRNAHRHFNTIERGHMATPNEYLKSFKNWVDFILYSGGEIGLDPNMIKLADKDIGVVYDTCYCKRAISNLIFLSGC